MNRVRFSNTSLVVFTTAVSIAAAATAVAALLVGCSSGGNGSDGQSASNDTATRIFTSDASKVVVSDAPDITLGCALRASIYTFDVNAQTVGYDVCGRGLHAGTEQTGSIKLASADLANVIATLQAVTAFPASTADCVPDGEVLTAVVTTTGGASQYIDEMTACSSTSQLGDPGYAASTGLNAVSDLMGDLVAASLGELADGGTSDAGTSDAETSDAASDAAQ